MRRLLSREVAAQVLLVVVLLDVVTAHVRLTYPPGRYIDLDFLDNARTKPPCGVPKKDIDTVTKLTPGQSFNTTWHLSYSHKGGYQLQILQGSNVVHWLTKANEWLGRNDVSSQNHMVTIPADFECEQCTIRLLRQASEWGGGYRFWSCAEVSIKKENAIDCSGHPQVNGKCQCPRLYSGTYCQYKDDCMDDSDCTSNGKCIDIEATSYPKRQCFCDMGYFGRNCKKVSPVKNVNFQPTAYTKKTLASGFDMFFRVIEESQELEVILQAESNTWLGVGWRPQGYGANCRLFPDITGKAGKAGHAKPEGEPEGEGHAEGTAEGKAEGKAEGEPEGEGHAEGTAEGKAEGEPEGEAHPEGTAEAKAEGKAEGEPEGEAHAEGTAEAKAEGKAEGEPEGEGHAEGTAEAKAEGKAEGEPEGEGHAEGTAEGTAEPAAEGAGHAEPETEAEAKPKAEGTGEPAAEEPAAEGTPEPGHAEPEAEAEGTGKPKAAAEAEAEGTGEPETEAEAKAEAKAEAEAEGTGEPETAGKPHSKGKGEPEAGAEGTAEGEAEGEGTAEGEAEGEGTAEGEAGGAAEAEGGGGKLHPMDCTDIVVGAARGDRSRIMDYYTRDRATPREDEVYGGTQGLTAAVGREAGGKTTLLFRRKLVSTERSDYTISKKAMDLIFARGQQKGNYIHSPASGYEAGDSSDKDFYHTDELKYHGHQSQRGYQTVEFMAKKTDVCFAGYKMPSSCSDADCDYKATWVMNAADDTVTFTIVSKQGLGTWTGLGFGKGRNMENLDVVLGWMDNGQGKVEDSWIGGQYTPPVADTKQDLTDASISYTNGKYTLKFTRKMNTGDTQDYPFSDSDSHCYTGFFVTYGGPVMNGRPWKHYSVPSRPEKKICIRECRASEETAVVSLRINTAWDNKYTDVGSDKSQAFIQSWLPDLTNVMIKKVPNIVDVQVRSLTPGSVIANLDVMYATTGGENEAASTRDAIGEAVAEEVRDMKLAEHSVDPSHVKVVDGAEFKESRASREIRKLEEIEVILIVVICVLVLIALIVMMVKCVEASRNGEELCGISFAGRRQNYSMDKKNGLFKSSTKF